MLNRVLIRRCAIIWREFWDYVIMVQKRLYRGVYGFVGFIWFYRVYGLYRIFMLFHKCSWVLLEFSRDFLVLGSEGCRDDVNLPNSVTVGFSIGHLHQTTHTHVGMRVHKRIVMLFGVYTHIYVHLNKLRQILMDSSCCQGAWSPRDVMKTSEK